MLPREIARSFMNRSIEALILMCVLGQRFGGRTDIPQHGNFPDCSAGAAESERAFRDAVLLYAKYCKLYRRK